MAKTIIAPTNEANKTGYARLDITLRSYVLWDKGYAVATRIPRRISDPDLTAQPWPLAVAFLEQRGGKPMVGYKHAPARLE